MPSLFANMGLILKTPTQFFSNFKPELVSRRTSIMGIGCLFLGIFFSSVAQLYFVHAAKDQESVKKLVTPEQLLILKNQSLLELFFSPLTAFFGIILFASALHFFIRGLIQKNQKMASYDTTLSIVSWCQVPMLFCVVPALGPMVSTVWVFVLLLKGLKEVYGLSTFAAFIFILTPALFLKMTWSSALQILALSL